MKILRIENNKVKIGTDSGKIVSVPIATLAFSNPQVGDYVEVYKSDDEIIVNRKITSDNSRGLYDRSVEIASSDLKHLSNYPDVQNALNRITRFGDWVRCLSIISCVVGFGIFVVGCCAYAYENDDPSMAVMAWGGFINCIFSFIYIFIGYKIEKLRIKPGGIVAAAIFYIALEALCIILGGVPGLIGIICLVWFIRILAKYVTTYRLWFYRLIG
ncbi:MAG: hypothetical protein LBM73_02265 [Candidatus Nomurabacteria bacterium]|jgi:hypothetical protein|nr:hypothetical protein [Candidatus Nomurabacteria bacterium]